MMRLQSSKLLAIKLVALAAVTLLSATSATAQSSLGKGTSCPNDFFRKVREVSLEGGGLFQDEVVESSNIRVRFPKDVGGSRQLRFDIKMPEFEEYGLAARSNEKIYRRVCGKKLSIKWVYQPFAKEEWIKLTVEEVAEF